MKENDTQFESQWKSNIFFYFLQLIFEQKSTESWPVCSKLHHCGHSKKNFWIFLGLPQFPWCTLQVLCSRFQVWLLFYWPVPTYLLESLLPLLLWSWRTLMIKNCKMLDLFWKMFFWFSPSIVLVEDLWNWQQNITKTSLLENLVLFLQGT